MLWGMPQRRLLIPDELKIPIYGKQKSGEQRGFCLDSRPAND
jgi:hypothetical protein